MKDYLRAEEDRPILVDTSVWIAATRRPGSSEADELRLLINRDRVATTDIVIAEILQGARSEEDLELWSNKLEALHYYCADLEIWRKAGRLSFELRNQGMITPLADLVVASVALGNELAVYAVDDHFARVPGLDLHGPKNYGVRRKPKEPEDR